MRESLTWRITGTYLFLILLLLLGLGILMASFTRSTYLGQLEAQLAAQATVTSGEAELALASDQELARRIGANSGSRITLIASDGVVLGDSAESPELMENHADRPEVIAALRGERGTSLRRSATLGSDMLYVAAPIRSGNVVVGVARAGLPLAAVDRYATALVGAIVLAMVVAALAVAPLTVWLGRTITQPLQRLTLMAAAVADGRLDSRLPAISRDEVGRLGQAFNQMADRLEETFGAISADRNRLAAILETVADGLVITDQAGRVLLLSPGAERLLRVNASEAIGEPFIKIARDHELIALLQHPDRGPRLIDLGRPRRQVRAVSSSIPGTNDQRLLLLQDVTELRRLEMARRDFVANVSHELRTPLAAIKALVETLEEGALHDPPAARAFLSSLHSEVDELTELVRELLDLSRIESGQAQIRPEPTEPEPLLRSAAERMAPLAQRAGVDLRIALPANLPVALADWERVRQVLTNLLHNAIKFTPKGGWVELRAEQRANDLAVSVADSGVGIAPDDLDRVFERFYKTDRSRSGGGTGLGLAIARHLVEAHGGRIWAEGAGSQGTTFTFTLPLAGAGARDTVTGVATWQES